VHLLLAFPLFVVVVGVDPRWLFHSLRTRLKAFDGQSNGNAGDESERLRWESTPLNYLEKIFQIPFTLRPMGNSGYELLIDDLTKTPESKERVHQPQQMDAMPDTSKEADTRALEESRTSASGASDGSAAEANAGAALTGAKLPEKAANKTAEQARETHERLDLTPWEAAQMKQLFALIPSPRATKRFVNVYRLLRGLTTGEERKALIGSERDGGYRPVLLLLAMVTGYPVEATEVMRRLLERLKQPKYPANWWRLLEEIRASRTAETSEERPQADADGYQWDEMFRKLADARKEVGDSLMSQTMGKWVPVVARYSFASGRLLVDDSQLPSGSRQVH
jgi:hypothetical protein